MALGALANAFIGLCLVFASVALLVSSLTEGLASILRLRSVTLVDGLKSMLNAQTPSTLPWLLPWLRLKLPAIDPKMPGAQLLHDLLNHAAINPLGSGDDAQASANKAPAYIPPGHFAAALIDVVGKDCARTKDGMDTVIRNMPDGQLKRMLQGALARSDGDMQKFQHDIASWYDAAMDRVGGVYKRYVQLWSFLIGLALAILFNIDAIAIVHSLLTNPALAASMQFTGEDLSSLPDLTKIKGYGLPIGWTNLPSMRLYDFLATELGRAYVHPTHAMIHAAGWLIMATASLFGAPFWFDTLQRFVNLRSTGDKPAPLATAQAAAAPSTPLPAPALQSPPPPPPAVAANAA